MTESVIFWLWWFMAACLAIGGTATGLLCLWFGLVIWGAEDDGL